MGVIIKAVSLALYSFVYKMTTLLCFAVNGSPTIEATICLKCGSQITHIPYRYNGQVFHARCLLCNACGESHK